MDAGPDITRHPDMGRRSVVTHRAKRPGNVGSIPARPTSRAWITLRLYGFSTLADSRERPGAGDWLPPAQVTEWSFNWQDSGGRYTTGNAGSNPAHSTTLRRHSGVAVFLSKPRRKQRLANPGFQTFRPEGLPGETPAGKEASGRIVAAEERTASFELRKQLLGQRHKQNVHS